PDSRPPPPPPPSLHDALPIFRPQPRDLAGELAPHLDAEAARGLLELDAAPGVLLRERGDHGTHLLHARAGALIEEPRELRDRERGARGEQRRFDDVPQV